LTATGLGDETRNVKVIDLKDSTGTNGGTDKSKPNRRNTKRTFRNKLKVNWKKLEGFVLRYDSP